MSLTIHSRASAMTLDEVVGRLAGHVVVAGVIVIGSAARHEINPSSDYDLIVVLSEMPVPLHVALTYVGDRLTDVIFTSVATLDRLLASDGPLDADTMDGKLIRWLQTGQVALDRSGWLSDSQLKARTGQRIQPPQFSSRYSAWFGANYDVKQTRRMMTSTEPAYQMAVDLRLLYGIYSLWTHYFRIRGLPWPGDKGAYRYVAANDPEYLNALRACLNETDRGRKMQLYERLASLTTAPMAESWDDGQSAIVLEGSDNVTPDAVETALRFWESLLETE